MKRALLLALCVCGCERGVVFVHGGPHGEDQTVAMGGPVEPGGAFPAACPSVEPSFVSACGAQSITCEYGAHETAACNRLLRCSRSWVDLHPTPPTSCQSRCPSSRADIQIGEECSLGTGSDPALLCAYADDVCGCSRGMGSDAGASRTWRCIQTDTRCPTRRPRIGQPCSDDPELICDYGSCLFEDGLAMQCVDQAWHTAAIDCGK